MARNAIKRAQTREATQTQLDDSQQAPEEGGTPGVPIERIDSGAHPNASTAVMLPQDMIVRSAKDAASERAPKAKCYTVIGDHKVNYQNFPYTLRHGKVVSETTHNIRALRQQGVRLEELPPMEDEEQEPSAAVAETASAKAAVQVNASMTPVAPAH